MILDVDIGNTRIKWRLGNGAQDVIGAVDLDDLESLADQLKGRIAAGVDAAQVGVAGVDVTRIRATCVAGAAVEQRLTQWCEQRFALVPEYARVRQGVGGVHVAYEPPADLGVDRWLAMLAAYHQIKGACIVLDAGSAMTADFIDEDGTHRGGLILPGARLMREALSAQTHGVKPGEPFLQNDFPQKKFPQKWQPGRDTMSCVNNAVAAAFTGLLNEVMRYGEVALGENLRVLVCGGDAEVLACCDERFIMRAGLVLDGLPIALGDHLS